MARERWGAVASPAQLNQIIGDFVGPSVVTAAGLLLPVDGAIKSPVHSVSVHGAVAGGGFKPPTSGQSARHIASHVDGTSTGTLLRVC